MEEGDISAETHENNEAPEIHVNGKTNQEQIHDILFSREISWQEIIYDLINTEQLDPWDIDLGVLSNRYLDKIRQLEEEDFFVSSKVLLAAAFLLRIKSELILSKYLKSIDEILFGTKPDEKLIRQIDWSEVDIDDLPELVPKSPMPRFKRVSLSELIESLNKAIVTENRRIKKEILNSNALRETSVSLPKRKFNPQNKSREIYERLLEQIKENYKESIPFTELIGQDKEDRLFSFMILLQLESQRRIWMVQDHHFSEIQIWPRKLYFKRNPNFFADLIEEFGRELEELENPEPLENEETQEDNSGSNGD